MNQDKPPEDSRPLGSLSFLQEPPKGQSPNPENTRDFSLVSIQRPFLNLQIIQEKDSDCNSFNAFCNHYSSSSSSPRNPSAAHAKTAPLLVNHRLPSQDRAFERLSSLRRALLFLSMIIVTCLQMAQNTIIYFAWETIALQKGMDEKTLVHILTGIGVGGLLSMILLKKLLSIFTHKALWTALLMSYCCSFYVFQSLSSNHIDDFIYQFICGFCLFVIGATQSPIKSICISLTSKVYPSQVGSTVQVLLLFYSVGNIIGPFSAGFLSKYISFTGIFYTYTSIIMVSGLIMGLLLVPESHQPSSKLVKDLGIFALLRSWRGFSNFLNPFLNAGFFRIQANDVAIYFNEHFHKTPAEFSDIMGFVTFLGTTLSLLNVFGLRFFDHRILHVFFSMIVCGFGYLLIGGFFIQSLSPGSTSAFTGLVLLRLVSTVEPSANMDLTLMAAEMAGGEPTLSTRDSISIILTLGIELGNMSFSILNSFFIELASLNSTFSIFGVILIGLGVNYVFASKLSQARNIWKKTPKGKPKEEKKPVAEMES